MELWKLPAHQREPLRKRLSQLAELINDLRATIDRDEQQLAYTRRRLMEAEIERSRIVNNNR